MNDDESGLIEDIDHWPEKLAPFTEDCCHHDAGGDAHLKALPIHHHGHRSHYGGQLDFGQRIFYAEFDVQRDKRVIVKCLASHFANRVASGAPQMLWSGPSPIIPELSAPREVSELS